MARNIEDDWPTAMRPPASAPQNGDDDGDLEQWALGVLGELELCTLEADAA